MAAGNAKYVAADYSNKAASSLEDVGSFLVEASNKIQSYVDNSANLLEGPALNLIKKRLTMYSQFFKTVSTGVSSVAQEIESCNASVVGAMGGYSEVSSARLTELQNYMNSCYSYYSGIDGEEEAGKKASALSQYNNAKKAYEDYKLVLEATSGADAKGAGSMETIVSNIDKVLGEIEFQSNLFN